MAFDPARLGRRSEIALVREKGIEDFRRQNPRVVPIPFSGFGAPLLALVEELGRFAPAPSEATATPTVVVPAREPAGPQPERARTADVAPYSPENRPFLVPFSSKGERVIGRDQALLAVRKQLTEGKPTAIGQTASFQGLGGLGKTQLAVEYAWRYGVEYSGSLLTVGGPSAPRGACRP
ncbi:MAG: hypothetical protein GY856_37370 [bacterium]|nr:hypothetical protein [bacterium]